MLARLPVLVIPSCLASLACPLCVSSCAWRLGRRFGPQRGRAGRHAFWPRLGSACARVLSHIVLPPFFHPLVLCVVTMAPAQKGFSWSNIGVGAIMNMFEVSRLGVLRTVGRTSLMFALRQVTTLGQPLEVVKTQMASNRQQTMGQALRTVWSRGGVLGFYQGLIPWVRGACADEAAAMD